MYTYEDVNNLLKNIEDNKSNIINFKSNREVVLSLVRKVMFNLNFSQLLGDPHESETILFRKNSIDIKCTHDYKSKITINYNENSFLINTNTMSIKFDKSSLSLDEDNLLYCLHQILSK